MNLNHTANLVEDIENPKIGNENISDDGMMFRDCEIPGISARDIRVWVADADGNNLEFKPVGATPKAKAVEKVEDSPRLPKQRRLNARVWRQQKIKHQRKPGRPQKRGLVTPTFPIMPMQM